MDRAGSGTHLFGAISNRELQSGGRLLIAREGPNGVREACQLHRYPRQNLGLGCLSRILCPLLSPQRDAFRQEFWRDLLPDLPTPTRGLSWCLPAAERYDDFEVVFVHRRNMADSGALLHRLFPATITLWVSSGETAQPSPGGYGTQTVALNRPSGSSRTISRTNE